MAAILTVANIHFDTTGTTRLEHLQDGIFRVNAKAIKVAFGNDIDTTVNPETGLLRYNTTSNKFEFYNNAGWYTAASTTDVTAIGTAANTFLLRTLDGANSRTFATIAGANTAVGVGANAYTSSIISTAGSAANTNTGVAIANTYVWANAKFLTDNSAILEAGTAAAGQAPLKFTSGTNLSSTESGAIEYDGTSFTITPSTNYGRATIPLTIYASGAGTALGTNTEATPAIFLPAASDRITLPLGTYFVDTAFTITRGASTTSATARLSLGGSGTAVGTFRGISSSSPTAGGATNNFSFNAVALTTDQVLTAASTTSAGVYTCLLRGILKITTAGTIIPDYSLSVNINGAGTVSNVLYFRVQQLDTQSAAAFGPAGAGWS